MEKFEFLLSSFIFYFAFFNSIYAFIRGQDWIFTLMTLNLLIPSFFAYLVIGHRQVNDNARLLKSAVIFCGFCLTYLTSLVCMVWYSPAFAKSDKTTYKCAAVNCASCLLLIWHMHIFKRFSPANDHNVSIGGKEKIHLFFLHFLFCLAYFCSIYVCVNQHVCAFTVISLVIFTSWFFVHHFHSLMEELEPDVDYLKYREIPSLTLFSSIGYAGFATRHYDQDSVSFILSVLNLVCYFLHFLYIYVVRWDGLDIWGNVWERSSPGVHPIESQEVIASAATADSNTSVPTMSASSVSRTTIRTTTLRSPVEDPSTRSSFSSASASAYHVNTNITPE